MVPHPKTERRAGELAEASALATESVVPKSRERFARFARSAASIAGHPTTFLAAALVIVAWALSGPLFEFSDTWQLVINTGTTIITFLMVFLIQNSQNRDSTAMQLKLDEIVRSLKGAHNAFLELEELDDRQLAVFKQRYRELADQARREVEAGGDDTGCADIDVRAETATALKRSA